MSADNGVYILKTLGKGARFHYRVAHLQSVENYTWDHIAMKPTEDSLWQIFNARSMWPMDTVFMTASGVNKAAVALHDKIMADLGVVEYGISEISIPRHFDSTETELGCLRLEVELASRILRTLKKPRQRDVGRIQAYTHEDMCLLDTRLMANTTLRALVDDLGHGLIPLTARG